MESRRLLCILLSCIVLTIKYANSQFPSYDPIINQDQIYFDGDRPGLRNPLSVQPASQQSEFRQQAAFNQQSALNQQSAFNEQSAFNQRAALNQQLLGIPTPAQLPLSTQRQSNLKPMKDTSENSSGMRAKKIIRLDETAASMTNFSVNLMKLVSQQTEGNTVVSPYSIATLLALLQQGATGETLQQLSDTLQMSPQTSTAAFKALTEDILNRSSRNILKTGNNIFLANGFNLNLGFRATALKDFRSDVTPTNFALVAQTVQEINNWVAERTNNQIQNLISPDAVSINTQMMLVNAMYFKGLWEMPFRRQATMPGNFYLSSRAVKKTQFMHTRRYFKTGVDSYTSSKIVVLPFQREEYSLMVILPHSLVTVTDLLSSLSVPRLETYLNYPHLEVELEMPKFSIKADTDLREILQKMGITKLFADANLSNIGTFQNMSPQVSEALHSAAFSIDEEGGTASAATSFSAVALSNDEPSVLFVVNRPFLAVLWDGKSNLPLFVAKIEDPSL